MHYFQHYQISESSECSDYKGKFSRKNMLENSRKISNPRRPLDLSAVVDTDGIIVKEPAGIMEAL